MMARYPDKAHKFTSRCKRFDLLLRDIVYPSGFLQHTHRDIARFDIQDVDFWKKRLLYWAAEQPVAFYLDSNFYPKNNKIASGESWECLVAAGAAQVLEAQTGRAFSDFEQWAEAIGSDWLFGFFSYDLKNEIERLASRHFDGIQLPDLAFVQPQVVVGIKGEVLEIQAIDASAAQYFDRISAQGKPTSCAKPNRSPLTPRFPKQDYLQTVEAIRQHIIEGDLYEMNLCQEFYAEQMQLDPLEVFERLNALARPPFAAYMRWHDRYLLSASPERFLKKTGEKLISQPIKGTRKRGETPEMDAAIRAELAQNTKDRAENVMIVDLVRNDLARHCVPGSVRVDELFGIYTFDTVHQMISTVTGQIRPPQGLSTIGQNIRVIRDAFPMGSMTGAPKVMAMQLIERYERSRRGLYSGALGYFDPQGDFDFNVVIRTILYNEKNGYVSAQAGGAIVYDSDPEAEYEEVLLKMAAMQRALIP